MHINGTFQVHKKKYFVLSVVAYWRWRILSTQRHRLEIIISAYEWRRKKEESHTTVRTEINRGRSHSRYRSRSWETMWSSSNRAMCVFAVVSVDKIPDAEMRCISKIFRCRTLLPVACAILFLLFHVVFGLLFIFSFECDFWAVVLSGNVICFRRDLFSFYLSLSLSFCLLPSLHSPLKTLL